MLEMLVVDDEPRICECLAEFFSAKGFHVSSAATGEQAVDDLLAMAFDVVLIDIRLPGIGGIEVLKRARELCPHAKAFMISAWDHDELRTEARAYGACGYIAKPFDFSDKTWASIFSDSSQ